MKWKLPISLSLLLLLPWRVYGADHTAASCSKTDIEAKITLAAEGDTVRVPAGNCTWASQITFTKGLSIIGAGIGQTVITLQAGLGFGAVMIYYEPTLAAAQANSNVRISGFTFDVNGNWSGVYIVNTRSTLITKVRVDSNRFVNVDSRAVYIRGPVYGVVDSNVFVGCGNSTEGYGTWEWDNLPRTFGTFENVYFEDNQFVNMAGRGVISGGAGGRYVVRYNTGSGWTSNMSPILDIHGNQPSSYSYMINEIYGNDFNLGAYGAGTVVDQRGGMMLFFLNRVLGDAGVYSSSREEYVDETFPSPPYVLNTYLMHVTNTYTWGNRKNAQALFTQSIDANENCCIRTEAWQPNTTYPTNFCANFTGDPSGQCWKNYLTGVSGSTEPKWSNTAVQMWTPADGTIWNSTFNGGWLNMGANDHPLVLNQDIWSQSATGTFDGTGNAANGGGVGCGPLASRPLTCITGVGYWATTQSCVDLASLVGSSPSTPISGTLYKCSAPNTWEPVYSPYTYPHPLRVASLPNAPTNVRIR